MGFSSDGAALMVGKQNGVAYRLKSDSPYMLDMHCTAHRLALSSLDAAKSVKEVRYFESMLHTLHTYFSRSSKRLEHLRAWQDVLEDPKIKVLPVHQVRWLSFANCVTNVRRTLLSLLKSLESDIDDDVMASSLFSAMSAYKFLFLTHFFSDIMADIATVSRQFQKRDISYGDLKQSLSAICDSIEQQYLVENANYGTHLREFLDTYENAEEFHGIEIKRSHRDVRLLVAVSEFADILRNSLIARFPKLDIWEAMSIFCPDTFPKSVKEKANFGLKKLTVLTDHFGRQRGSCAPPINANEAKREWPLFKNHMFALSEGNENAEDILTGASLAEKMIRSGRIREEFPQMIKLMTICRVLPVSSVECERGFSVQNLIKTRTRCSLNIELLDELMRISINGPKLQAFNPLPIYRMWRDKKQRHIFVNTQKQDKLVEKI
ncbi:zinc finger protein 862-like [Mercenaria mercenaria]|uniref:zinc finger protein 862-like n=1 Tax=Mercenaria mercenaria TaxID=6596 RepID=UPI00234F4BEC|nr:zinc finger protein 862-like [Mercenaria mercenaria]